MGPAEDDGGEVEATRSVHQDCSVSICDLQVVTAAAEGLGHIKVDKLNLHKTPFLDQNGFALLIEVWVDGREIWGTQDS